MEDWKILILIGAILIIMAGVWYCIKLSLEDYKKRIWVYTKTGNQYIPFDLCKMKNHDTGEWIISVAYRDEKGNMYIRERQDFLNKFVKLKDWENGSKGQCESS